MKIARYILIATTAILFTGFSYCWFSTGEEWEIRKRCAGCEVLESQRQQRMVGTVDLLSDGKIGFTEQLTGITYHLVHCDLNCETKELIPFSKLGVKDKSTNQKIYFDIEGKYFPEKEQFIYSSIIVLDERIFLNPKEINGVSFEKIKDKYTTLEEETFLLNESHYAGLREFLPHYFSEKQLTQPIPLKEATWETSDSTLITIWFMEKQNQWMPIESYEWKKGTEF